MFWRIVGLPFRVLMALPKALILILFLLALVLAFAAVTAQSVNDRLSGLAELVSPNLSLRTGQQRLLAAERNRADSETKRADAAVAAAGDLKERNQALSQNNDALSATNTALKQQGDTLTQANTGLSAQIKALTVEAAKAHVDYQGRTIPVSEAVTEATARLSARVEAEAKRRAAIAPGAALPFWGIPIIASGTAQDIVDDCAQLRDLHGLDVAFNPNSKLDDGGVCKIAAPDAKALWSGVQTDAAGIWGRMQEIFSNLPALALPDWWQTTMSEADSLFVPMPEPTVKP